MVRFTCLASGSKGNSAVVSGGSTTILVDAGLSCREILRRMVAVGEDPAKLDAILITHEHVDHIRGLGVMARRLGIPVYLTEATHRAWVKQMNPQPRMTYAAWMAGREAAALTAAATTELEGDVEGEPLDSVREDCLPQVSSSAATALEDNPPDRSQLPSVEYFRAGEVFSVGDFEVSPFTISHDAVDPVGFVLQAEGARVAVATDLGYMAPNVAMQLKGVDLMMLESNHDLEMLRDGPYPWSVKQRVLSRVGHLSNDAAAEFLEREYDGGARWVVLAHLSESNNLPELARMAAERALAGRGTLLGNRLLMASQHEPMPPVML